MMKKLITLVLCLVLKISLAQTIHKKIIDDSRNSCVKIMINKLAAGTGFFVSKDLIVTCFHVIAQISNDNSGNISLNIYSNLQAVNEMGDTVNLSCVSMPTQLSPEPLLQDFALLKTDKEMNQKSIVKISEEMNQSVGDDILFTGYPLGTPTMVTHYGIISGITKNKSIICIQSAVNKGNSGGALLDRNGKVIGIISMREGGLSLGLQNYLNQISNSEKMGSITIGGTDPLQVSKETIKVLDTYISTGIGYARRITFLKNYLQKNKIKL